jgi:hypothetical protein
MTTQEIIQVGADALKAAQDAQQIVLAAKKKIDAHNATPGAKHVNTGSLVVALGGIATAIEQAGRHVADNTPAPAPVETPAA